jgi:hypothetical protein
MGSRVKTLSRLEERWRRFSVMPSLEASLTETQLILWQCGRWLGWLVCSGREGVQGLCGGGKVQRAHGCWRSLSSVHGAVVTSATAGRKRCSHSSFTYLSPWQRSARRWKRRGPHAEWPGSVFFIGAVTGFLRLCFTGAGGSTIMSVRLEEDSLMVEEFR